MPVGCEAPRSLRFPKVYGGLDRLDARRICMNQYHSTQRIETLLGTQMRVCDQCFAAMMKRGIIRKVLDTRT